MRSARASWRDIGLEVGLEVGLSANAVAQWVRRLRETGVVLGFTVQLDPAVEDAPATALVLLRAATDADSDVLEAAVVAEPALREVLDVAGPWDDEVRVSGTDPRSLHEVVRLRLMPGVTAVETRAVLREVLPRRG